jgi:hypothetical protein
MALGNEYGLASRVWLDDGRRKARERGKPVIDNPFVDSYSISLDDKAAAFERMLRNLSPGLNEWAVHPAHGTEAWQTIEPTKHHRHRLPATSRGVERLAATLSPWSSEGASRSTFAGTS